MQHGAGMPCIVGAGACTAVGNDLAATAAAVRAGIPGFADHPWCVDSAGAAVTVARAPALDAHHGGAGRFAALAVDAALQALASCGGARGSSPKLAVCLGLPGPRPGLPADLVARVEHALREALRDIADVVDIGIVRCGHSGALIGLELARQRLASGSADLGLVGGVDSYLDAETLEWLESRGQLHSAGAGNNAWGFIPGEAAGWCVLASAAHAREAALASWGRVRSTAVCQEPARGPGEVCLGRGLTEAFLGATGALALPRERVDHILCDMNGEPQRAEEFGFASLRTHDRFEDPSDFIAPADCWGDVGAASGPLLLALACTGRAKGYLPGDRALVWTSSESGERAAALLDFTGVQGARR